MTMRAGGHSILILAGLLVCFAGPSLAATDGDASGSSTSETAKASVKHSAHHWKKYTHHKSGKVALKSAADHKADAAAADDDPSAVSPAMANANAQMTSAETTTGNASAMTARANDILQAAPDKPDGQSTADSQPSADHATPADQLSDVDRALPTSAPAVLGAPAMAIASADTPPEQAEPVAASPGDQSTLDENSLIGKIFIGAGALLTMASAARMFMA